MPNTRENLIELSQQWFVPLEEKHEPITIGGQRGGGKIFHLEGVIEFLREQLKQEKTEKVRWKSAALYYKEKCETMQKLYESKHWMPLPEPPKGE